MFGIQSILEFMTKKTEVVSLLQECILVVITQQILLTGILGKVLIGEVLICFLMMLLLVKFMIKYMQQIKIGVHRVLQIRHLQTDITKLKEKQIQIFLEWLYLKTKLQFGFGIGMVEQEEQVQLMEVTMEPLLGKTTMEIGGQQV